MISNQASRNGATRGHRLAWGSRRCRAPAPARPAGGWSDLKGALIATPAIALALWASAPHGALAQSASASATPGAAAPAAAPTGAALPGASIRKAPEGSLPAASATTGNAGPSGASSISTPAAAGVVEGAGAPAALATPAARAKTRAAHRARPTSATEAASAKADSKDAKSSAKAADDSKDSPFSSLQFAGNKGPIDIKSDALDLDYKNNVVTFRGHVHAIQADATLTSDTLTVTYGKDFHQVQEMVANNNVRMSQGTRWATGDKAVLDQAKHTVTLTGSPVVHDGEDQVAGSKITVHLDTGKSEVEGARAVFFPKEQKTRDNSKTTVAKTP